MPHVSVKTVLAGAMAAALAVSAPLALHAQADKAHALLDKATALNGLTGADAGAWHIKANYTLYDPAKGIVTSQGTFEEWSTGPWNYHRIYTEKKISAEEWSAGHGKQFKTKDAKLNLTSLDASVAGPLTNPLAKAANFKPGVELKAVAGKFDGEVLDCINAADPAAAANGLNPDLIFERFCFDVKDSTLRYATTSNTITAFSEFKPLGSRQIATKVQVKPYNKLGADLVIDLLEALPAGSDALVAVNPKAVPAPWPHQPDDAPLVPVKITECSYPMAARNNREFGPVSIPVIIQKNGSVKGNGYPMGPQNLAMAAGDCIGSWKFQPFLLDGQPTDTSYTLIYTFDLKPWDGKIGIASQTPAPPAK